MLKLSVSKQGRWITEFDHKQMGQASANLINGIKLVSLIPFLLVRM